MITYFDVGVIRKSLKKRLQRESQFTPLTTNKAIPFRTNKAISQMSQSNKSQPVEPNWDWRKDPLVSPYFKTISFRPMANLPDNEYYLDPMNEDDRDTWNLLTREWSKVVERLNQYFQEQSGDFDTDFVWIGSTKINSGYVYEGKFSGEYELSTIVPISYFALYDNMISENWCSFGSLQVNTPDEIFVIDNRIILSFGELLNLENWVSFCQPSDGLNSEDYFHGMHRGVSG